MTTRALFLGAGASYDAGMQLVSELTAELRCWLTPEKLVAFNDGWRARGGGWSPKTISTLVSLLQNGSLHYEQIIGAMEVDFARERNTGQRQEFHAVNGFLLQATRGFLFERQIRNLNFALSVLDDFDAIKTLVENNRPLWVFSTNHDLIVEMLAAKFAIPIKSGFKEKVTITMKVGRDQRDQQVALDFERLPRAAMATRDYDFFKHGEVGINLIKLHGSIDIFGQGDELSYIKVASKDGSPTSYVRQLQALAAVDLALGQREGIRANNEHCYFDSNGVLQFLRNSLLSGAHKFSPRMTQIAPPEFMSLFRDCLHYASELLCIGCSFGDHHINEPIVDWLSQTEQRRLVIVNPGITCCPDRFGHLCRQVSLVPEGARTYFLSMRSRKDSVGRSVIRYLQLRNRKKKMKGLLSKPCARGR